MTTVFEPEPEPQKIQFQIVGIVASPEYQTCRCYAERLHKSLPQEYAQADLRPLLNVEWDVFLNKIRRRLGGEKLWALRKAVVVFKNGELLGDDQDMLKLIAKKYRLTIMKNFRKLGKQQVVEHICKQSELGLYADLVPAVSELFMKLCTKIPGGYAGTPIQRIVKPSWIQCGGWNLKHSQIPCENYIVSHDRRGVLSMCHNGKHKDNSTQFFITLDPTPWMDYKYVAFGQLIQGEEVLKVLENIPTHHEAPLRNIQIVKCGEFTFYPPPDPETIMELNSHLTAKNLNFKPKTEVDPRDVPSVLHRSTYKKGLYCLSTDMRSYLPLLRLPEYLIFKYLTKQTEEGEEEEKEEEKEEEEEEEKEEGKEEEETLQNTEQYIPDYTTAVRNSGSSVMQNFLREWSNSFECLEYW